MIHGTVCVHSVCGFVIMYLYSSINFFCRTGSDVSATSSSDSTTISSSPCKVFSSFFSSFKVKRSPLMFLRSSSWVSWSSLSESNSVKMRWVGISSSNSPASIVLELSRSRELNLYEKAVIERKSVHDQTVQSYTCTANTSYLHTITYMVM